MAKTKKEENSNAKKTLDNLMDSLNKKHGTGMVMVGNDIDEEARQIARWSLDSPDFIDLLGGGFPKGRIIEIFGPESSGKTTLATYFATQIQKNNGRVAIIDAENSYDLSYAESMGLNVDNILFTQPDAGEDALEIAEDMVRSNLIDLIIIDSVAALTPRAEIEAEMGDKQMGEQARLMSKACRKLRAVCKQFETSIIFINQIRMKIGVMFGNPETTSGGRALKYYSSIRLDVRRKENITGISTDDIIGITSNVKTIKSKVSRPYRKVEIDIIFNEGIDIVSSYINYAVNLKIINKAGSWYSYKEEKIGQGKSKVKQFFIDNPDIFETIKKLVNQEIAPILKVRKIKEKSDKVNETKDQ